MPMYEYRCTECGDGFESFRRASERASPIRCPACGERIVADRVWSTIAVRVAAGRPKPRSGAGALAGPSVRGTGTMTGHGASSIVQASCGGMGHRH
jgi:putative FmdB family regulatory protein